MILSHGNKFRAECLTAFACGTGTLPLDGAVGVELTNREPSFPPREANRPAVRDTERLTPGRVLHACFRNRFGGLSASLDSQWKRSLSNNTFT